MASNPNKPAMRLCVSRNPSTPTITATDPTITRLIGLACGSMTCHSKGADSPLMRYLQFSKMPLTDSLL